MYKKAFTLAEVLITLAIIGIVAALTIPSVITNTQQAEFKTGLKKAISVLNSAITMNIALENESPYDNQDLFNYLQRHMSILKSTTTVPYYTYTDGASGLSLNESNAVFYTTDGMRFEFNLCAGDASTCMYEGQNKLHESDLMACTNTNTLRGTTYINPTTGAEREIVNCGGCGSLGLKDNPNGTAKVPCLIMVDVNGDKKPTPGNINCQDADCGKTDNLYKVPLPGSKRVTDIFSILITEDRAIPYGVTAQKAMYGAQK